VEIDLDAAEATIGLHGTRVTNLETTSGNHETLITQAGININAAAGKVNTLAAVVQSSEYGSISHGSIIGTFVDGEPLTFGTSGATAKYSAAGSTGSGMKIYNVSVTKPVNNDLITGLTSGATAQASAAYVYSGGTSRLKAAEETLDAAELQWTVKLNNNNHVAGVGLLLDPYSNKSEFAILADMFKVVNPNLSSDKKQVFTVGQVNGVGTVGINGNLFIDGSVHARSITAYSISADRLSATHLDAYNTSSAIFQQSYSAPGDNNWNPGTGLKITGGRIEAYGSSHALGGRLVSNDGYSLHVAGGTLTGTGIYKRYPLVSDTNVSTYGGLSAAYKWNASSARWAPVYIGGLNNFEAFSGLATTENGALIGLYGFAESTGATNRYGVHALTIGEGGVALLAQATGLNSMGISVAGVLTPLCIVPSTSPNTPAQAAPMGSFHVTSEGNLWFKGWGNVWRRIQTT